MNKFDPTKPVQTRDGRKARIICTDAGKKNAPIIAIIYSHYGDYEGVYTFTEAGKFHGAEQNAEYVTHLVNIPEKTKFYRILFTDGKISIKHYATPEAAAFDVSIYPSHMKEKFMGYQETVLIDGEVTAFNIIKKEA